MCRVPLVGLIVLAWVLAVAPAPGQPPSVPKDAVGDSLPKGARLRIGTIRWRPGVSSGWRDSSTLSADGRTVYVGDVGAIRAFDLESGLPIRKLRGHDGGINAIAVSRDGKLLASAGYDKAFLWDLHTGKPLRPLKVKSVTAMAFTPDGTKLITGGDDQDHSVRILDVATGKEILRLLWHQRRLIFVGCCPDNRTLVTASWDNHIRITDLTTGEVVHTCQAPAASGTQVALAPDGKTLAVADMRDQHEQPRSRRPFLRFIDTATGKERQIATGTQRITALAFSPDRRSLVTIGDDAQVYDVATGRELRTLKGVRGWRFTPDGRQLVATGNIIRVWDFTTGKELHPPAGPLSAADSLAFSPDGKTLAGTAFTDRAVIQLWDVTHGKLRRTLTAHETDSYIRAVQFTPDGRLVSGGSDSTMRVWDIDAAKELLQFKLHHPRAGEERLQVLSMHVAPDGSRLVAAAIGFGGPGSKEATRLFAWSLTDRKLVGTQDHPGGFGEFPGFSADCRAFLAHDEKGVVLKELAAGKELLRLQPAPQPGGEGVVNSDILESPFVFSPDGKVVAVHGSRQRHEGPRYWRDRYSIILFDLSTGKEIHRIAVDHWLAHAAFPPDSKRLAAADGPGVRIWDAATGKRLWESPPLDTRVTALAFSRDGRRLATALQNITILVWDVGGSP